MVDPRAGVLIYTAARDSEGRWGARGRSVNPDELAVTSRDLVGIAARRSMYMRSKMPASSRKVLLTAAQRKTVAELLPRFTRRLKLREKNPRTISFTTKELETIQHLAEAARLESDSRTKRNAFERVANAVTKALAKPPGIASIPAEERLYQFRISLQHIQPEIWRRIQVLDCTLDKFHEYIQAAMGWTDSEYFQFEINGKRYRDPESVGPDFLIPENVDPEGFDFKLLNYAINHIWGTSAALTRISEIVPKNGKRFKFEYYYDYAVFWEHQIVFEKCLRAKKGRQYPVCLAGQRACPPDGLYGIHDYADFLEAIADPDNEELEDMEDWVRSFDPEYFDAEEATLEMQYGLAVEASPYDKEDSSAIQGDDDWTTLSDHAMR